MLDDTSSVFYAPDGEALASLGFLATHCLHVEGDDEGRVGLGFEPRRGREQVDVRGVLWLDKDSGGPEQLDFEYTGVKGFLGSYELPLLKAYILWRRPWMELLGRRPGYGSVQVMESWFGGTVHFEQVAAERWLITEWSIVRPALVYEGLFGATGAQIWPRATRLRSSGLVTEFPSNLFPAARDIGRLRLREMSSTRLPSRKPILGGVLSRDGEGSLVWGQEAVWLIPSGEGRPFELCRDLVRSPQSAAFVDVGTGHLSVEVVDEDRDGTRMLIRFTDGECMVEDRAFGETLGRSDGRMSVEQRYPFAWVVVGDDDEETSSEGISGPGRRFYSNGEWVSTGVFTLDYGFFLQVLSDLESDRRHLVIYDDEGLFITRAEIDVPFGVLDTDPDERRLLAVRRTDSVELVTYKWEWIN